MRQFTAVCRNLPETRVAVDVGQGSDCLTKRRETTVRLPVGINALPAAASRGSVLFMYLGRRGSLARFSLELAQAVRSTPEVRVSFAVSAQNRVAKDIEPVVGELVQLHTFDCAASLSVARNFFF